jgi:hypothetical protein
MRTALEIFLQLAARVDVSPEKGGQFAENLYFFRPLENVLYFGISCCHVLSVLSRDKSLDSTLLPLKTEIDGEKQLAPGSVQRSNHAPDVD